MPAYALDIRNAAGPVSRIALDGQPKIVGRTTAAGIYLNSPAISRRHAEFSLDPFGRWWVRDLGSHNGTLVNNQRVTEQVLNPGDVISIGEFFLTLATTDQPISAESTLGSIPVVEADAGRIATLRDFETPRLAATHLSMLADFGQQLLALESPTERLDALCALMIRKEVHARSAIVLRASKESFTEPAKPLCSPQSAPGQQNTPYISRTLLRTLLARNEPVLASNTSMTGGAAAPAQNVGELSIAADVMAIAAVACPIHSHPTHTDLLYVLFQPEFGTPEWLALTALAVKQFQLAESAWSARKRAVEMATVEADLRRAHLIQERLVPRNFTVPGLDFAIAFTPCRWVGGDYVDIVKGADGRVLLTIADVCGKGLPAALIASSLHMHIHTSMHARASLQAIMQNLNVYLAETLAEGTFVTMIAALLDPAAGTLELINAGHPAGFLFTHAGEISLTQQGANLPLGLDASAQLLPDTTTLPAGAYLLLYTDGLSELHIAGGNLLGEDALANHVVSLLKSHPQPPATTALSDQLTTLLDSLQEGISKDDRTFLLARRL